MTTNFIYKSKRRLTHILLLCISTTAAALLTASCSTEGDDPGFGGDSGSGNTRFLTGTRWSNNYWDYGIGDDWVSIHEGGMDIIFYSDTEGVQYIWRKDSYSDIGDTHDRFAIHFNYTVEGNTIEMDFISDIVNECVYFLTYKDGKMVCNEQEFYPKTLDSSTSSWLAGLHGKTGDCRWYYDLYSTIVVKGNGAMADYDSFKDTPWSSLLSYHAINNVRIEEGVTHVGDNAFAYIGIGDVDLKPWGDMTSIGKGAFKGSCISNIDIPNKVETIGEEAFSDCKYLTKANIPEMTRTIGDEAFFYCKSASLLRTPNLKKIGNFAFHGCSVDYFTESQVLEDVGNGAFSELNVSKLSLPNSLTTIGNFAFVGTFSEIIVGENLNNISGTPFSGSKTGSVKINMGTPPVWGVASGMFIDSNIISGWNLYVPKGCKSTYSTDSHFKGFKNIYEDANLKGEPSDTPNGSTGDDSEHVLDKKVYSYQIDGKEYKMIYVQGNSKIESFWMMETEMPTDGYLTVDDKIFKVDKNDDGIVIKSEFRNFIEDLREETRVAFRLPTLAEWQYAAKGGINSKGYNFSGSNNLDEVGWYADNSSKSVHGLALKKCNELGLYDMSGNYAELTNDTNDIAFIDGSFCGGSWKDATNLCRSLSWKEGVTTGEVPGTRLKEKNAYDSRYISFRLVFSDKIIK